MTRIPLCAPHLGGNEAKYLQECVDSGWISSAGPFVNQLEELLARALQAAHGVATSSGTAALHLALLVAGVRHGEEVLVSDLTFVAPANAIRYLGAEPVLVDCEVEHWQMDVGLLKHFFAQECQVGVSGVVNRRTGRRVAAIVPVHVLGHPVDMDPLVKLADQYGIPVVEDASEALGSLYKDQPVGSCGRLSCLSFNGNKIVTGGGGGLVTCNDQGLAERVRYLSTQAKDDPLYYVHHEIGYNYRLTNLQAAVVLAQFEQLPHFLSRKRQIASTYQQILDVPELELPCEANWAQSSWWLYTVLLKGAAAQRQDEVLRTLQSQGIEARPLWNPIHQNRPFQGCQLLCHQKSQALDIVRRSISLPSSVGLSDEEQRRVCEVLLACVKAG